MMETISGWLIRSDRSTLRFRGPDRARSLQNLVTNDVAALTPGQGCEAFVTSPQGKTLGFVTLLVRDEEILLRTEAEALAGLIPHFTRYCALDDVSFGPAAWAEWHAIGFATPPLDLPAPWSEATYAHVDTGELIVIRESWTGRPSWTVLGPPVVLDRLAKQADQSGLLPLDPATFEALRVEGGYLVFGREVTAANLPQEFDRDATAISFKKGCYLGQETVARLDALGHVNKILRVLICEGDDIPPPGAVVSAGGQAVGMVTSSGISPEFITTALALAMVRVKPAPEGSQVSITWDRGATTALVARTPYRALA